MGRRQITPDLKIPSKRKVVSHQREFLLTFYDSSIFNLEEIYSVIQEMATQ